MINIAEYGKIPLITNKDRVFVSNFVVANDIEIALLVIMENG